MASGGTDLVDLTAEQVTYFDSEEDEAAFTKNLQATKLYKEQVFRLKQNDANFCMLNFSGDYLSLDVCERIGFYLARNSFMKNIKLNCNLDDEHFQKLFSATLDQRQQNDTIHYIERRHILETILNVGDAAKNVIEYLAFNPLSKLVHVNLSDNYCGKDGLNVLVKALSGTPISELGLSHCGLHDFSPLILGGRELKQLKKFELDNNYFLSTDENGIALSVLFDDGYPRLRELSLRGCSIDSDIIEVAAPSLSSNQSLRYIFLMDNPLGDEGVEELIWAICDPTNFETIFASNHTLWKVVVDGGFSLSAPRDKLQLLTNINHRYGWVLRSARMQRNDSTACRKMFNLLADNDEDIDPSIVFHYDIGLLPLLFQKLRGMLQYPFGSSEELTVIYKVLRCKAFHKKLQIKIDHDELRRKEEETRMRNEQLEADNANLLDENRWLKEQIALMIAQNGTGLEIEQNNETIASRVKRRAQSRKRGRV